MTDGKADQVPDEPTGTTIDGTPWEEARPPHLPDTVTGLPVPTILFTLGAIVVGFLTIRDRLPEPGAGPGGPIVWVLSLTIPIVSFLIPAVFFLRHRDAWSAHRAMALGTAFRWRRAVLELLNGYLGDWFDSIVPPSQLGINPLSIAMQVVVSLYAVLAVVYMARGLIQARLYADRPGMRRWWVAARPRRRRRVAAGLRLFGALSTDVADENFVELLLADDAQRGDQHRHGGRVGVLHRDGDRRAPRRGGPELRLVPRGLRRGVHPRVVPRVRGHDRDGQHRRGRTRRRTSRRCSRRSRRSPTSRCSPRSPCDCRRRTRRSTRPRTRPARTASAGPTTRPRRSRPRTTWRARPPRPGPPAATPRGCAGGSGPRRPIRSARTGRASGSTAGRRARRRGAGPRAPRAAVRRRSRPRACR